MDLLEFYQWHLNYVIDQIKMADNKMNFLLAIFSSLLGATMFRLEKIWYFFIRSNICCKITLGFIFIVFIGIILYFYFLFNKAINPRIEPKKIINDNNYTSVIFWGDVAQKTLQEFGAHKEKDFKKDIQSQIIINSKIAQQKFNFVKKAYNLIFTAIVLFIILIFYSVIRG